MRALVSITVEEPLQSIEAHVPAGAVTRRLVGRVELDREAEQTRPSLVDRFERKVQMVLPPQDFRLMTGLLGWVPTVFPTKCIWIGFKKTICHIDFSNVDLTAACNNADKIVKRNWFKPVLCARLTQRVCFSAARETISSGTLFPLTMFMRAVRQSFVAPSPGHSWSSDLTRVHLEAN